MWTGLKQFMGEREATVWTESERERKKDTVLTIEREEERGRERGRWGE